MICDDELSKNCEKVKTFKFMKNLKRGEYCIDICKNVKELRNVKKSRKMMEWSEKDEIC